MQERIIENKETGEQIYFLSEETIAQVVNNVARKQVRKAVIQTCGILTAVFLTSMFIIAARLSPQQCTVPFPDPTLFRNEKDSTFERPNGRMFEDIRSL